MEEVISGWHYDRILTQRKGEIQIAYAEQERIKRLNKENLARYQIIERTKSWAKHGLTPETAAENVAIGKTTLKKDYTQKAVKEYDLTRKAHPILIGPATLDSLFESEPDRMDYIKEGKFPFDDVFFEFMEPVDHRLPGYSLSAKICGLQLNKIPVYHEDSGQKTDIYNLATYFSLEDGTYGEIVAPILQKEQLSLEVCVRLPRNKERLVMTRDIKTEGELAQLGAISNWRRDKDMPPHHPYHFTNQPPEFDFPLENVDLTEVTSCIGSLNTLGVNIINFINAQNVTLVPHDRKVRTRILRPGNRPIVHEANAPYHIVSIDTKFIDVEEDRESTGTLPWRVYVRGHNRKYRDDQGTIRLVTWVTPHVRGPDGAPWRHHRYAVLAEMLQKERNDLTRYVPKIPQND